jgi:protein SCO1/2
LTGSLPDVKRVAGYFGVEFWRDEGTVVHSLNTVVIDREGRLAANVEGNALTPDQLVELVSNVLTSR